MDARFLIRLRNNRGVTPTDQPRLLADLRGSVKSLPGRVLNLRISPLALEFDLFESDVLNPEPYFKAWEFVGPRLTFKSLAQPPVSAGTPVMIDEARRLFNEFRYWEVHEVLEVSWKKASGAKREWLQGLILAAAALVHAQKNEPEAVWGLLRDAHRRLHGAPDDYFGWKVRQFGDAIASMLETKCVTFPSV